ncbi:alginate lyase [Sphingomonas oleivorans]|uniref:Alginate lyase n=1 Tax=Sphingomonas oleivorans TaxID=1735121 RepID=A0A2T5FUL6_9SPHN|nr:alginate lyase family protein [Sphingomonas oleivorans]PTQ08220.1 alginate lyase [Sphingomonas oleivorans]
MPRIAALAASLVLLLQAEAAPVASMEGEAPVLLRTAGLAAMTAEGERYPLFARELQRMRAEVDAALRTGISVPIPKDPGGGLTHEQHKRNYKAIYGAGLLYRITGNRAYADFARRMLLDYAKLYPSLGAHPAAANEAAGRLFWQSLNDSVWLVYAVQGYDAIRDAIPEADRKTIDENVFRRMATFLSDGSPALFNRIHNHATWASAGVGMTGYVLRDPVLVEKALNGLDRSGRAGFLRQLDLLFSPDGYYAEGPYYQRYALLPFVLFAQAIEANEPQRRIFAYRDGIILKAIRTTIQLSYDGYFFPLNDAMPDKSLRTEELYQAVATGYGATRDPAFLSIAGWQGRTLLSPEGLMVARDLAAGRAMPFPFASMLLSDGPDGDKGGLAIMRSGAGDREEVLVAKNTAQGMGHGHFDKLGWILYDNGNPIVTDYGAARFLNIEAKDGGRYLPENESWAKQTIAHNTLVVNETSHFGGKVKLADTMAPRQIFFHGEGATQLSTAEMVDAYPGVRFRRTLAQLAITGFASPVVLDLMRVTGSRPAQYDLPLHYAGHLIDIGFPLQSNVAARPVLGKANGYQHLWVDATGAPGTDNAVLTWLNGDRFYSYRMLPPSGAKLILAESGANDPRFNLRREPVLIQRLESATAAVFVGLLEPHGAYDAADETTVASRSRIRALRHERAADADIVTIELADGRTVTLAIADDPDPAAAHRASVGGRMVEWKGHFGRFDGGGAKMAGTGGGS